jgi:hypothetical protein
MPVSAGRSKLCRTSQESTLSSRPDLEVRRAVVLDPGLGVGNRLLECSSGSATSEDSTSLEVSREGIREGGGDSRERSVANMEPSNAPALLTAALASLNWLLVEVVSVQ